jgi:hypothetical protein
MDSEIGIIGKQMESHFHDLIRNFLPYIEIQPVSTSVPVSKNDELPSTDEKSPLSDRIIGEIRPVDNELKSEQNNSDVEGGSLKKKLKKMHSVEDANESSNEEGFSKDVRFLF